MSPRIERIQKAVQHLHGYDAKHVSSVPLREQFNGQTVWEGVVEVFNLGGHPKANRCYAWSWQESGHEEYAAVLEIPPVTSPETAVKAYIASLDRK